MQLFQILRGGFRNLARRLSPPARHAAVSPASPCRAAQVPHDAVHALPCPGPSRTSCTRSKPPPSAASVPFLDRRRPDSPLQHAAVLPTESAWAPPRASSPEPPACFKEAPSTERSNTPPPHHPHGSLPSPSLTLPLTWLPETLPLTVSSFCRRRHLAPCRRCRPSRS